MIAHMIFRFAGHLHRRRPVVLLLASIAAGACQRASSPVPAPVIAVTVATPPPISPWPGTLSTALRAAENGRFDEAERVLTEFSVAHPSGADGAESDFWRALLKTDPANRSVTPRESMALYDSYLGGGASLPRHAEALILRRVVESMDSTRTLLATVRASADARDKARDDEIRRLNDILDRTTAELERIKRRLVPKP